MTRVTYLGSRERMKPKGMVEEVPKVQKPIEFDCDYVRTLILKATLMQVRVTH